MSVIVDTSVWSLGLRRSTPSDHAQVHQLRSVISQGRPVVLLGIILQELLTGMRSASEADALRRRLDAFEMLVLERDDYVAAAELSTLCRRHGVQTSTADSQIAAVCIRHDCALLTADRDFEQIARFCPLQLL